MEGDDTLMMYYGVFWIDYILNIPDNAIVFQPIGRSSIIVLGL